MLNSTLYTIFLSASSRACTRQVYTYFTESSGKSVMLFNTNVKASSTEKAVCLYLRINKESLSLSTTDLIPAPPPIHTHTHTQHKHAMNSIRNDKTDEAGLGHWPP